MGVVTGGMLKLLGKCRRLSKVARPPKRGAFFRFPFDLMFGEAVIGNGAFDLDAETQAEGVWMLQIELEGPTDCDSPRIGVLYSTSSQAGR